MAEGPKDPNEHIVATRTIDAPAHTIFTVLADPARHRDTEPTDWVRDAIDPIPITATGQIFSMNMHFDEASGDYQIDNTVTTFEPDHAIAWDPGQADESGHVAPGGWRWRYDLEEKDTGTEVKLTYDWSRTTQEIRDAFGGFPVVSPDYLDRSLRALEQAASESR
ncbi:SRPBCC domain-containing protein [Brevibacterium sp. RIT 803]|uniref:SRPBCC domain-containing protein n=1 Tax=Brevibacterium sp. RIT 803 TaxID=2810210 RepID=UPI001951BEC3|nr:SRPBCC domain-containing protein [Brevibacterium sp. RIT 803]MBM6590092.1 SRPBCC domain-containing protein [Brevibacterium sp. RIT 803]